MQENIGYQGFYKIYINGKYKTLIKNRVMDTVLDQLAECMQGDTPDLEIKYLAVGHSATPLSNTDTQLYDEYFRTPITTQEKTATGEITTDFSILSTEAIGQIEEIGIFGGGTATSSADSGTLISRILWSHDKTSAEEITVKRIDKISRG